MGLYPGQFRQKGRRQTVFVQWQMGGSFRKISHEKKKKRKASNHYRAGEQEFPPSLHTSVWQKDTPHELQVNSPLVVPPCQKDWVTNIQATLFRVARVTWTILLTPVLVQADRVLLSLLHQHPCSWWANCLARRWILKIHLLKEMGMKKHPEE